MAVDVNVTKQGGSDSITTIRLGIAAAATGLALAQTPAAAGNLTLNGTLIVGGAYSSNGARRMVTVSDNVGDTTQNVTFTGTDRYGNKLLETVTLNGTNIVTTSNDFLTVTQVAIDGATLGNVTVGTSATASGAWVMIERAKNNPINIQLRATLVTGSATFSVQETVDDPNFQGNLLPSGQPYDGALFPIETNNGVSVGGNYPPIAFDDATISAKSATTNGTITAPFWAYRLTVTTGTGTVQLQGLTALTGMSAM